MLRVLLTSLGLMAVITFSDVLRIFLFINHSLTCRELENP
jgi:hypothetical protein